MASSANNLQSQGVPAEEGLHHNQSFLEVLRPEPGKLVLQTDGRLDFGRTPQILQQVKKTLLQSNPKQVIFDASGVNYCDGSGLALLLELKVLAKKAGFEFQIKNLAAEFTQLLDIFDANKFTSETARPAKTEGTVETIGLAAANIITDLHEQVTFLGQLSCEMVKTIFTATKFRWKDALLTAERAGADAVGIVSLLGFLFGLIIAFSSAMPLQQFGIEVYVTDLVAIALVRVLGPFITAIILAGRTSSSFAAELGTMKVNNEIDALSTMGLDPVRFLVIPRVVATIVITPLLTVLANLAGLIGSAVVILSLGFPLVTYVNRVTSAIDAGDVWAGLAKALVYGGIVGAIGCLRGLQTKIGASAVGISTTRAVVSGIVLIVITEGIFAILYYHLGI